MSSIVDSVMNLGDEELIKAKDNKYADIIKNIHNHNDYQLILLYLIDKDSKSSPDSVKFAQSFKKEMLPLVSRHNQMLDCISKNNVLHEDSHNSIGGIQVLWDLADSYCKNEQAVPSEIIQALKALSNLLISELVLLKRASQQQSREESCPEHARRDSGDSTDDKTSVRLASLPKGIVLSSWNNLTVGINQVPNISAPAKKMLNSLSISA